MPQRVHSHMDFRAFGLLVAVKACASAAFRRGTQSAPVENCRCGLGLAPARQAQHLAQVVDDGLKAACSNPALGLLIERWVCS